MSYSAVPIQPKKSTVCTHALEIAYEEWGAEDAPPVILLHGFPDDVRAWDAIAPPLARAGHRILVPYLRGFGPTRFRSATTLRIAQQASLGQDVLDFMDVLTIPKALLAGYDWGCGAACVATVLQPDRVRALLAIHGYGVGDTVSPPQPAPAHEERECWYHWYFHLERGRVGLAQHKREICRLLWQSWSPNWRFDEAEFNVTAHSFENPDFVSVVIHAYRHAHGNTPGDPALKDVERYLAGQPSITVPSLVLHGADDTVHPPYRSEVDMARFPSGTERRIVPHAGHFLPREQPSAVVEAIQYLLALDTVS